MRALIREVAVMNVDLQKFGKLLPHSQSYLLNQSLTEDAYTDDMCYAFRKIIISQLVSFIRKGIIRTKKESNVEKSVIPALIQSDRYIAGELKERMSITMASMVLDTMEAYGWKFLFNDVIETENEEPINDEETYLYLIRTFKSYLPDWVVDNMDEEIELLSSWIDMESLLSFPIHIAIYHNPKLSKILRNKAEGELKDILEEIKSISGEFEYLYVYEMMENGSFWYENERYFLSISMHVYSEYEWGYVEITDYELNLFLPFYSALLDDYMNAYYQRLKIGS